MCGVNMCIKEWYATTHTTTGIENKNFVCTKLYRNKIETSTNNENIERE